MFLVTLGSFRPTQFITVQELLQLYYFARSYNFWPSEKYKNSFFGYLIFNCEEWVIGETISLL